MGKQVRRILIGMAVIMVCLTGLLAVSALVPEVKRSDEREQETKGKLMRNTRIYLTVPDIVKIGQSFSINGTLEMTDWNYPALWGDTNEPFPYQRVTIDSKLFRKEVITDAQGNFSSEFTVFNQGTFQVIANYAGDELNNFRSSSGYKVLEVVGRDPISGNNDFSNPSQLPYIIVAIIIVVIIAWEFLYRRFAMNRRSGKRIWVFPVWLSFILATVAVGSLVFAILPRQVPIDYPLSRSGTSPGPAILAGLSLKVPEKIHAGDTLVFKGSLWQWENDSEAKTPLPQRNIAITQAESDHFPILVKLVATDKKGNFAGKISIKKTGKYYITARFFSPGGQLFDSNTEIVVVGNALPFSHWNSPGWLIVYVLLLILLVLGHQLIYLPRRRKENLRTTLVFMGFSATLVVLELVAVISAFYPQAESPVFRMDEGNLSLTATHVTLKVPEKAEISKPFILKGTLTKFEDTGEAPLPGQEINVYLVKTGTKSEQMELLATIVTDNTGDFSDEVKVNSPGYYEISAVFENTGSLYYQSGDTKMITAIDPTAVPISHTHIPNRLLLIILSVLIFLTITVASYFLGRYGLKWPWYETLSTKIRRPPVFGHGKRKTLGIRAKYEPVTSPIPAAVRVHNPLPPINIEFPRISAQFPDVWGKGDSLLIVFTIDGTKHILDQYSLDIEFGNDSIARTPISLDGHASQEHIFHQAGQYQVQAVLVKDIRNGYLPASRIVRIVDYREEIVRLYNDMVISMQTKSVKLTTKMTAREVENRLRKAFPEISIEITESLVSVFEEANYSLHPISRPAYEKMYLAVQEVDKYARK